MATLIWRRPSGSEQTFSIGGVEVTIGRDPSSVVCLDSAYVSKRHAVVRPGGSGFTIADLGSSNGTRVNGAPVTNAPLVDGDVIELGAETLVFRDGAKASPPAGDSRRRLVLIGGLAAVFVVAVLALLVMTGGGGQGSRQEPDRATTGGTAAPVAPSDADPADRRRLSPPGSEPESTAADTPQAGSSVVSQDAGALYDMALAHIRGGRLVEARGLLQRAGTIEPANPSVRERLREVEAAIQREVERRFAEGQRAFTYLRFDDAIIEWEQVVAMTDAGDARHQQAATGIEQARARLAQR
jgi:hypothetical protein